MLTHPLPKIGLAVACLCASAGIAAQNDLAVATRVADLQQLAQEQRARAAEDRRAAGEFAQRLGIPVRRELPGGRVLELQRFDPVTGPVFYITNNVDAADTVSTDELYPGGSAGLNLDGGGMTVAEWDGGAVFADHPDFAGRLTQVDGATTVSNHSTHVAGTLVGAGTWLVPDARGMAYAAHLDAYDWNFDTAEMASAAAAGLLVSNHSYGIAAGWLYFGGLPPDAWWWIGGDQPSDVEDPNFGYYDAQTQLWDQVAFNAPYYLIVKAAGNDRTDIGPAPGEEYTVVDQDGNFLFTSTLPRNPDCWPAGYDCLPTASVAKNILTVGAVDDIPGGYSPLSGPSSVQMADFSSWGPSDDGRIKPDLVGNGMFLMSTWGDSPYFAAAAGTSMAAPNVTGSLLLLQQHHENLNGTGNFLRAATLKALAIHTADEAGSAPGPDYAFGWGLLNSKNAAEVITEDGGDHQIVEGSLADGATDTVMINVTAADSVLTATLVWADPPATPVAPTLDPPDLMLVNDLDLRIIEGGTTYLPWVLDPSQPANAATTGDNFRDNVEQVEIDGAGIGTYTIQVSHKGSLLNNANQDYALIISVTQAAPTGSGLAIDEDFSAGMPTGWSVDTVTGVSWTINTPVPGDPRLDNGTGGSGQFAMVDNGYAYQTITSLQTHLLDLSANNAAVLRFSSYYYYDTFETLNVDASTDGGGNWFNVWSFMGFNPLPTRYVLDLSSYIAGEANVRLRFRFDSGGFISGDFWQVDDVELEVFGGGTSGNPPGQAGNPSPADGAADVDVNADLGWSAGTDTDSHDVYFGTNATPDAGEFQGNQPGTAFDPGTLADATTYYWRIDEVNTNGTTTGNVWSFTTATPPTLPGQAGNPSPADGAADVDVNADLGWSAGTDTDSHDVYFGTNATPDAGEFQGNQPGTAFDPGTLADATTYYWRIDEVNTNGTTTGNVWSFTTATPPTLPGQAGNPSPADGAADVDVNADLGWSAGTDTDSHDVYFGTNATPDAGEFQGNQPGTAFDPGTLADATTYYWRIDEVNTNGTTTGNVWSFTTATPPTLPGQAGNPSPADGAADVDVNADLGWSAGTDTDSHDVYFGTNATPDAGEFQGNQPGTAFDPGTLADATTYYWRIDEVNTNGTTTGNVWSFTTATPPTLPGQAGNPSPADGAADVDVNADLGWSAGTDTDSHDVYFGTNATPDAGEFQGNQPGTAFDPGTLADATTYYWRIDEVNTNGTTTGNVWSFTTAAAPAQTVHLADLHGVSQQAPRGRWNAVVTIVVEDAGGTTVAGALAEGSWSNGTNGGGSCTTGTNGSCEVLKQNLKGNVASVDFTVTNLTAPGHSYNSGANEVADTVTVYKVDPNLLPVAVDDNFSTPTDTLLSSNAMANDDPGDAPATASADSPTSAAGFPVSMATDGSFTYTPSGGFQGADNFGYTITDSNGDSDSATVNITVGSPPPLPGQASNPSPTNGAVDVSVDADLGWSAGTDTDAHDVYFGTDATPDAGEFQGNQAGTSFDPGTLADGTTYYWRIDEVNATGTTNGSVWSFTTVAPPSTRSVTATKGKLQGNKVVTVTWSNFIDIDVTISRNGVLQATVSNSAGSWVDNLGKKPSGTFTYEVCEAGPSSGCASDSVSY